MDEFAGLACLGLLAVIAAGDHDRLHTCVGRRCQEVFVDLSRNRSRRYCSPAICGNRAHAAARRNRARGRGGAGQAALDPKAAG
jgi:predicted RNA-binding Zn ribbon-like protein